MTPTATRQHVDTRIEGALRLRFAERCTAAQAYGPEFAGLWQTAADHALGGKLIRPRLLLDVHRSLTLRSDEDIDDSAAVDVAAQIELLHYAFLLHDDVIDGDLTRRRRPNLIGSLSEREVVDAGAAKLHWARASAILMGDLLLTSAILGFARAEVASATRDRLLELVEQAIFETVAGEHADVALSDRIIEPDMQSVLSMSEYKTATYSFALPLRAAAVLATAAPSVEATLATVGRHLGLAYQLQDDLLCVFGDPASHGKDPYSDLREGKQTALIAYARLTSAWSRIETGFGRPDLTRDDAAKICDLLRECGAERFVATLVDEQLAAVTTLLADAEASGGISAETSRAILGSAARLEQRQA